MAPDPDDSPSTSWEAGLTPERHLDSGLMSESQPMVKWAGQPSAGGGLGGSTSTPTSQDDAYDPSKKPGTFTEIGASGLAQYGGFVRDEFLPQLQGDNALHVYREMYDNDPVVGSLVFAIQMLCRQVEWRVEPPEASSVEDIVQERIEERVQARQAMQQAQQAQMMQAQAGLAGNAAAGSPRGAGPGGKPGAAPPPHMPTSSLAGGAATPSGMHQPAGGSPTSNPQQGATPPGAPGPNARDERTLPGSNSPDVTGIPDQEGSDPVNNPGTNPGGGPAQAAALAGNPGLGSGMKPDEGKKAKLTSESTADQQIANSRDGVSTRIRKFLGLPLNKAGAGAMVGGINMDDPAVDPQDPETNEDMEWPQGEGPMDITPEARKQEELAVFIETCMHDLNQSWSDVLAQIITMIVFGWAYHEIVYKKRNGPNPDYPEQGSRFADGRIGWAKLAGRAQETRHRWEFDETGSIIGMWQLSPPKWKLRYIPLSKALLFRTTTYKNNPEGRSCLRSAYRPWYFKKRVEEYEAIGVERNLGGLPVIGVPAQMMSNFATDDEKATLTEIKKIARNLKVNEQMGVVFPIAYDENGKELFTIKLLSTEGGGTSKVMDTDKIITRYEQRMAMTSLADFILLGHDAVGARSLGETKADLFTTALEAWLQVIADVFNTYAIPRLMQMNGEDPAQSPKLTFGKMETISLEELGALITAMSGAGFDLFSDPQLEDYLREKGGMPPKASSEDL